MRLRATGEDEGRGGGARMRGDGERCEGCEGCAGVCKRGVGLGEAWV